MNRIVLKNIDGYEFMFEQWMPDGDWETARRPKISEVEENPTFVKWMGEEDIKNFEPPTRFKVRGIPTELDDIVASEMKFEPYLMEPTPYPLIKFNCGRKTNARRSSSESTN